MTKKEREKDRKIYRERSVETTVATYGRALLSWVLTTSWLERRRASKSVATATRRRRTLTIESACMCVRVKRAHASSTLTPSSPYLNFLKLNSTILFFPPPLNFQTVTCESNTSRTRFDGENSYHLKISMTYISFSFVNVTLLTFYHRLTVIVLRIVKTL